MRNCDYRWDKNVPCAHIAAPTRLDIVKTNPTTGMLSRSAATNPNTEKDTSMRNVDILDIK